jgi:hypothetical protein
MVQGGEVVARRWQWLQRSLGWGLLLSLLLHALALIPLSSLRWQGSEAGVAITDGRELSARFYTPQVAQRVTPATAAKRYVPPTRQQLQAEQAAAASGDAARPVADRAGSDNAGSDKAGSDKAVTDAAPVPAPASTPVPTQAALLAEAASQPSDAGRPALRAAAEVQPLGKPVAANAQPLPPRRIEVQWELVAYGMALGDIKDVLEHDGVNYQLQSEMRGKGLLSLMRRGQRSRSSRGAIDGGLLPKDFVDEYEGTRSQAQFDHAHARLVLTRGSETRTETLSGAAYDSLSFLYSFAFAFPLASTEPGSKLRVSVSDGRSNPSYSYQVAGWALLKTAMGERETLHLVKEKPPGDERGAEIWLSPKDGWLPLRVLLTEKNGSTLDQMAVRIAR